MKMYYYKSPKKLNIKKHFIKRCLERVGILFNSKDIVSKIQKGELQFLHKTSNTRTVFKYISPIDKKPYKVVYDKNNHDIVTIYPFIERRKNVANQKHRL